MRKTAWVLTGLMVVSAAAAMAAEAPATDMSKDKGTMAAPAGDKMDKPMTKSKGGAKWDHVTGEVTAMDATAKTFTVKAKAGDKNLKWDDKTVVTPKGQTPAMGDKVSVTTAKDSDMATKIAIHKASKKMDKTEKKSS
jgi:hypothetical protein